MNDFLNLWATIGIKEDSELQRQVDSVAQTIKNGLSQVLGVALPAMTVGAFARMTDNMANRLEKLSNAGKSLNMGVSEIDKWTGAMEIAGVSADQFIGTLGNINNQIREISRGQRPAMWIESIRGWLPSGDGYRGKNGSVRWLQDVAKMAKDNNVKENSQLYAEMSNALTKMGVDGKTAYALLNGELDKYLKQAEKLGVVTEEDEKKARRYLFAQRSISRAWTVMQTKIMSALAPAFETLADCVLELTDYMDVLVPVLLSFIAPGVIKGLQVVMGILFNPATLAYMAMWVGIQKVFERLAEILEGAGFKRLAELAKHPITIGLAGAAGTAVLGKMMGGGVLKNILGPFLGGVLKKKKDATPTTPPKTAAGAAASTISTIADSLSDTAQNIIAQVVNITAQTVNVMGKNFGFGGGGGRPTGPVDVPPLTPWSNQREIKQLPPGVIDVEPIRELPQGRGPLLLGPGQSTPPPVPPTPPPAPKKQGRNISAVFNNIGNKIASVGTTVGAAVGGAITKVNQKFPTNPLSRLKYNVDWQKENNRINFGGDWAKTAENSEGLRKVIANAAGTWEKASNKVNDVKGKLQYKADWAKEYNQQFNRGNWLKTAGDFTGLRKNENIVPLEKAKGALEKGSQKVVSTVAPYWNKLSDGVNSAKERLQYKANWAKEYNQQFNQGNWLKTAGDFTGLRKNENVVPLDKINTAIGRINDKAKQAWQNLSDKVNAIKNPASGNVDLAKWYNKTNNNGNWGKTLIDFGQIGTQKLSTVADSMFNNMEKQYTQMQNGLQRHGVGEQLQHTWQQTSTKVNDFVDPTVQKWKTLQNANQVRLGQTTTDFSGLSTIAKRGKIAIVQANVGMEKMLLQAQKSSVNAVNAVSRNGARVIQNLGTNSESFIGSLNKTISQLSQKIKSAGNKMGWSTLDKGTKMVAGATGVAELANQGMQAKDTGKLDLISAVLGLITAVAPFFGAKGYAVAALAGGANLLYDGYKENNNGQGFGWATVDVGGGQNGNVQTQNNTYNYYVNGNMDSGLCSSGMPGTKSYCGGN